MNKKTILKTTTFVLIQIFLLVDLSWGSGMLFSSQKQDKTCLSPAVQINNQIFVDTFNQKTSGLKTIKNVINSNSGFIDSSAARKASRGWKKARFNMHGMRLSITAILIIVPIMVLAPTPVYGIMAGVLLFVFRLKKVRKFVRRLIINLFRAMPLTFRRVVKDCSDGKLKVKFDASMFTLIPRLLAMYVNEVWELQKQKIREDSFIDSLKLNTKDADYLKQTIVDMAEPEDGKPMVGRQDALRKLVSNLSLPDGISRSVLLTGKPGVSKKIVVKILAKMLKEKRSLQGELAERRIYSISAKDFEEKQDKLLPLLKKTNGKIILFIDKIHTLTKRAEGRPNFSEVSNLKKFLKNGKVCIIGATSIIDCIKYIEPDVEYYDNFCVETVKEPGIKETRQIVYAYSQWLCEKNPGMVITKEARDALVDLPEKHWPLKAFPTKSIDLLDELVKQELTRTNDLLMEKKYLNDQLKGIIESWVNDGRKQILREEDEIKYHNALARRIIGIHRVMLQLAVRENRNIVIGDGAVKERMKKRTGISTIGISIKEKAQKLKELEGFLSEHSGLGQQGAINVIADVIRKSKLSLSCLEEGSGGVVLMLGPRGVGKTSLARSVSKFLLGNEEAMIHIDMTYWSQQKDAGALAAYLCTLVRHNPYAVILFDNIDQGEISIFQVLLSILTYRALCDEKGSIISFKDTMILMSSDIGMKEIESKLKEARKELTKNKDNEKLFQAQIEVVNKIVKKAAIKAAKNEFTANFMRLQDGLVVCNVLTPDNLLDITRGLVKKKLIDPLAEKEFYLEIEKEEVYEFLAHKGYDPLAGVGNVEDVIKDKLIDPLMAYRLGLQAEGIDVIGLKVYVGLFHNKLTFAIDDERVEKEKWRPKTEIIQTRLRAFKSLIDYEIKNPQHQRQYQVDDKKIERILSYFPPQKEGKFFPHAKPSFGPDRWIVVRKFESDDSNVKKFKEKIGELLENGNGRKTLAELWIRGFVRWTKQFDMGPSIKLGFRHKDNKLILFIQQNSGIDYGKTNTLEKFQEIFSFDNKDIDNQPQSGATFIRQCLRLLSRQSDEDLKMGYYRNIYWIEMPLKTVPKQSFWDNLKSVSPFHKGKINSSAFIIEQSI
ncbi:MAG: ATP-dependent Clp protease ATP-binding subunit [PVC group bacterium]|nr:ATP-dependent Clp protease ATP-binding subunit [PVC group bacterium]